MPTGYRTVGVADGPTIVPRLADQPDRAGALDVLDYRTAPVKGTADAGGTITATLQPVEGIGVVLLVDRIVVVTNSTSATTLSVYLGAVADENLVDFSPNGNIDVADETQPLFVPGSTPVTFVWRGASAGAVGTARVQYRVARFLRAI